MRISDLSSDVFSSDLRRESQLIKHLTRMRAERWRRSGDFARRLREPRRDAGEAYGTVGRVDCLEETDGIEMRVVEQLIGCAQRRGRNAELAQQVQPFLRRAPEERSEDRRGWKELDRQFRIR